MATGNRNLLLAIFGVGAVVGLVLVLRRPPTLGLQAVGAPNIQ